MKIKEALDTLPESMWDVIDAAVAEVTSDRPADTFTVMELAERKQIGEGAARTLISKMLKAGSIKMVACCAGNKPTYYQLVRK